MEVDIFIATTFNSPARTSGKYSYLLRYFTQSKHEAICWDSRCIVSVSECTQNHAELLALRDALGRMKKPCTLSIYTDCAYLESGIEQWSDGWIKNGWKNAKGKPVANATEWQEILYLLGKHENTRFYVKANHEFYHVMMQSMKEGRNDN